MVFAFLNNKTQSYSKLETGENGEESATHQSHQTFGRWRAVVGVLVLVCISAATGFLTAKWCDSGPKHYGESVLLPPSGSITTVMKYNRTFSDPPSEDTSQAWNGIYPKGVGFVQHPTLAPEPSGLSVFHQLHCLDALRIAYYTALQGHPSHPTSHADHNEHDDPHHVRHCFDYIRQSLMCHADTNLEPVDPKLGGTTGWGSPKTCRDYHSVKQWAKHWMARKE